MREEKWGLFYIPVEFGVLPSPLRSSLRSLISDYKPCHKLVTQFRTLTNFLIRLGVTDKETKGKETKQTKGTSTFKGIDYWTF